MPLHFGRISFLIISKSFFETSYHSENLSTKVYWMKQKITMQLLKILNEFETMHFCNWHRMFLNRFCILMFKLQTYYWQLTICISLYTCIVYCTQYHTNEVIVFEKNVISFQGIEKNTEQFFIFIICSRSKNFIRHFRIHVFSNPRKLVFSLFVIITKSSYCHLKVFVLKDYNTK